MLLLLLVILLIATSVSFTTVREGMRDGGCKGGGCRGGIRRGGGIRRDGIIRRGGGLQWGLQDWRRKFRRWSPIVMPVDSWWPRFSPPCKEGCTLTGNGGYGCTYPGNGYNQCQFAQDCSGCQVWW